MMEWGQKSKPKKIHGPNINAQNLPCRISEPQQVLFYFIRRAMRPGLRQTRSQGSFLSDCFEYPKTPNLNRATQKSNRNKKFQPPQNTPIIRIT